MIRITAGARLGGESVLVTDQAVAVRRRDLCPVEVVVAGDSRDRTRNGASAGRGGADPASEVVTR